MPARRQASQILTVEIIGFLVIIALSWANELYGLPSLIFGGGHRVNWPESLLETAIIALVAIPVLVLTRRLVLRLHYLEGFMGVCGWCRKLNVGVPDVSRRAEEDDPARGLVRRSPASVRRG